MADRGNFRGSSRGGSRGGDNGDGRGGSTRGDRGGRGRGRGGGGAGQSSGGSTGGDSKATLAKKAPILDLAKYLNAAIHVKFNGGREVTGLLKGYDGLMNLVLDEGKEIVRDDEGNESSRNLGLVVARGTLLVMINPVNGSEEIANPFVQADETGPMI